MLAQDLLQVLLPDNATILSASLPVNALSDGSETTVELLLGALLADPANARALTRVFGHHFDAKTAADAAAASSAGAIWRIDASGMSWALQTVESSQPNREWQDGELEGLGDGESLTRRVRGVAPIWARFGGDAGHGPCSGETS